MANHSTIVDEGDVFQIIASTRKIVVPNGYNVIGTQGDHKSEKLTFKCPATIDGHDIENCSSHYVSWTNAGGDTGRADLVEIEAVEDGLLMRWDIEEDVTSVAGAISFAIWFEDRDENGLCLYRWQTTSCKELQVLASEFATKIHREFDSQNHFIIDPIAKTIVNTLSAKPSLTQYDHNSSRFTFEIPRHVEEQDLSECNRVEIHFDNKGAGGQHSDVYLVDDLKVDPTDNKVVIFTWLVSENATNYDGTLTFSVHFIKTETDELVFSWNTPKYESIAILPTHENTASVVDNPTDLLASLLAEVDRYVDEAITEVLEGEY